MRRRGIQFRTIQHGDVDGEEFYNYSSVINCAAYIPKPAVVLCDQHVEETLRGNLMLPLRLARKCDRAQIPFMHISTGCLYNDSNVHSETDTPQRGCGGYAGIYVGTKLLSEEAVSQFSMHYVLRIRLPFDQFDNERNYFSKIAAHPNVWNQVNSLSHRADIANAALDLLELKAEFGIYNMANLKTNIGRSQNKTSNTI